jgi:hypothetical protein
VDWICAVAFSDGGGGFAVAPSDWTHGGGFGDAPLLARRLDEDNPIAFRGEAGYQAELLMPGCGFSFGRPSGWRSTRWVQVPAGQIGVVIAQVGAAADGRQERLVSARLRAVYGAGDVRTGGRAEGRTAAALAPGTTLPLHPVAFLVITRDRVSGGRRPSSCRGRS